jgi:hypothetical protein
VEPNAFQLKQHLRRFQHGHLPRCGQHVIAFSLHCLNLLEQQQLETVDLPDDLPLQIL